MIEMTGYKYWLRRFKYFLASINIIGFKPFDKDIKGRTAWDLKIGRFRIVEWPWQSQIRIQLFNREWIINYS